VRSAYFRTAYSGLAYFKAGFMTALSDGLTVGVDLGGTKIAAGAVDPASQIVCAAHLPTPRDPELILGAVIDAVRQIRNGRGDVRAIGIGAAGHVDEHRSTVHFGSQPELAPPGLAVDPGYWNALDPPQNPNPPRSFPDDETDKR
jgi:ROK family